MKKPFVYGSSQNWSDMRTKTLDTNNSDNPMDFGESVEASDGGEQVKSILGDINAEFILLKLLSNLDDKGKIILMFQIMKGSGFEITQEDCAKVMGFNLKYYNSLIQKVKNRCIKIATEHDM